MKRTGEPHIWEEKITDSHSLIIDTVHNNIKLVEDIKTREGNPIRTVTEKTWQFDHEPTLGDFGEVMMETSKILDLELV